MTVARRVEVGDLARLQVDALDAAADVVVRLVPRHDDAAHVVPLEATVVADVARAVRPDRRAVRPAAALADDGDLPVPRHAREGAATDLDDDDAAVGHGDRSFGKLEAGRDGPHAGCLAGVVRGGDSVPAVRCGVVSVAYTWGSTASERAMPLPCDRF